MMRQKELAEYAERNGLPFDQVLGWYVTGVMLYLTERIGFSRNLVVVTPSSLDPAQDRLMFEEGIRSYYIPDERITARDGFVPGCAYRKDFRERLLLCMQAQASKEGFPLEIRIVSHEARAEIYYDEMYIPLDIRIAGGREIYSKAVGFDFFDPEIPRIDLNAYPRDALAATYVSGIMEKLELVGEMEIYLYLYRLLQKETISGRDICERIKEMHGDGWKASEKSLEMFASYDHNSYMKKKWKVLLRRHHLKEPAWENVMSLLKKFITPIWNSLTTETIFFAEWMPELGRYLD